MIRIHKRTNQAPIKLVSEPLTNTYYGLQKLYNKQDSYQDLIISKNDLWNLTGYKGKYNSLKMKEVIEDITRSNTYDVSEANIQDEFGTLQKISGSLFIISEYKENFFKVEIPITFRKLMFYKRDIDLMEHNKNRKHLKMNDSDLDYFRKEVEPKKKFLMLLNEADLLKLKGKYNKRLYALLKQWEHKDKIKHKYTCDWKKFVEILEIPKSYISSVINKRILEKAKVDLLKANLKITKIDKPKKGRSIDKIIIEFETIRDNSITVKAPVSNSKVQTQVSNPKSSYKANKEIKKLSDFDILKNKIMKWCISNKKMVLLGNLNNYKTLEDLEDLMIMEEMDIDHEIKWNEEEERQYKKDMEEEEKYQKELRDRKLTEKENKKVTLAVKTLKEKEEFKDFTEDKIKLMAELYLKLEKDLE